MRGRAGRVAGRVLLKRECGLIEGLGRDFRSSRVLLFLSMIVIMGGGIVVVVSQLASVLPLEDVSVRMYFELLILGMAATFFLVAAIVVIEDRHETVITDTGILYAGIFQRWAEIRCCVMRKTRSGLIVWTRSRRRLRMYFRGQDAETIEQLFHNFCSAEAFVTDCLRRSH
ncbi:MAG: hypothetical protein A4E28_02927 [Methanocella sp. PtaU1.Bin125]|nr:MAG: hypothetical protein A4E28_02927 [Methanocella sp. PtaU1.Bin125]